MPLIQQNNDANWSLLDLVNRIRNECGIESVPSSAVNYDVRSVTVANAVNDAVTEIWRAVRWPWTRTRGSIAWVAGTSEYNLPNRFMRVAMAPEAAPGTGPMNELPVDEWVLYGLGSQDPYPTGTPATVVFYKNYFKVWPAPSTDFVAAYPTLTMEYFRTPPPRVVEDNDGIEVPTEFVPAVVAYGKWKLKLHIGDSDWKWEQAEFERQKTNEIQRYHVGRRANQMIPDDFTPSVWG